MDQNQFADLMAALNQWERSMKGEKAKQNVVATQSSRITKCDGVVQSAVREWLTEVELARPYCNQNYDILLEIAAATTTGSLRREVERFIHTPHPQGNMTWDLLKDHIRATFLSVNEDEALRREVERIVQGPMTPLCATADD